MSPVMRVTLLVVSSLAVALTGCGGSSSANLAPTPTGSFTNANLSGSYAFAVTGTNTNGFFSVAGSIQADGNGNITSGREDVNSVGTGPLPNVLITGGTYSVSADGRGRATVNSSLGAIDFDFVLLSSGKHGLIIRFDTNASASGTLDLQDSTAYSAAALQGQFAFNLSGIDSSTFSMNTVGNFTADGVSALNNGLQDTSDFLSGFTADAALSGSYTVAANGRGTASFVTASGTQNFAFYVVNASHVKMIEADGVPIMAGDAFRQPASSSNATVTGPYAYTVAGESSSSGPFASGGLFAADGNGNITGGVQDINNSGSGGKNVAVTGTYSLAATGRGLLTLSGSAGVSDFVFYPTASSGLQMMGSDPLPVVSGTAFAQQPASYSLSSLQTNYGFNISGVAANAGEVDAVALITANGTGKLTGDADFNFSGALSPQLAFDGTYTMSSNGRGTAILKSSEGTQNFTLYVVSPSQVLLIETDPGLISAGTMLQQ
jgi:hypothetical protein